MDKSEELFQKRLADLADAALEKNIVTFTDFMNLNELHIFHTISRKFSFVQWKTFGGYGPAERQIAAFIPDTLYYEWEYPISVLEIRPLHEKYMDALTHRDYLGAILNLGIDRGKLGDILVEDCCAYLFCMDTMAEFLMTELVRVRHTAVLCKQTAVTEFQATLKTERVVGAVASIRLDSVLALAFHGSRSQLVLLIEGGKVFVNGKLVLSNGYTLKENDMISVRGMGKFKYLGVSSQTKKGRYYIALEKYI